MSERRIAVPMKMLEAVNEDVQQAPWLDNEFLLSVLEAALGWLAENPIVPTREQATELFCAFDTKGGGDPRQPDVEIFVAVEWQRRMFLAPEPEWPGAVRDLLTQWTGAGPASAVRDDIIEAFHRGQKVGLK